VTWERVVSGRGWRPSTSSSPAPACRRSKSPTARWLADRAARARSLELFLAAYGAFAGDMALACLARGGVFLAGGIAAKLLPLLPQSGFLAAFNAKAEHAASPRACRSTLPPIRCWDCAARCSWHMPDS
jgi:glucokinase